MRIRMMSALLAAMLLLLGSCGPKTTAVVPPGSTCVDFQAARPEVFPGPTFEISPLRFRNPTSSGAPLPITLEDRIEDQDGRPELGVAISRNTGAFQPLTVEFPRRAFPDGVKYAYVTLRHSYSADVIGKDRTGVVVATAGLPTQHTRGVVALHGPGITSLELIASETMLYSICWI